MSGRKYSVHDMAIDEVSLVDVPAAPGALVLLQKNFQEGDMPDDLIEGNILDAQGNILPDDYQFVAGETYFAEDGTPLELDTTEVEDAANEREEVEVGKSAFFSGRPAASGSIVKSLAEELRETLSKSNSDAGTREVLHKALEAVGLAEANAARAELIAKSERNIRLTGEFIEVAKSYNVPSDPTELGGVLLRMAETMADADCAVIHKALTSAGEIIFEEQGLIGTGTADGSDPMEAAEQYAAAQISKSATGASAISKAASVEEFYLANPGAYDEYLAAKTNR